MGGKSYISAAKGEQREMKTREEQEEKQVHNQLTKVPQGKGERIQGRKEQRK